MTAGVIIIAYSGITVRYRITVITVQLSALHGTNKKDSSIFVKNFCFAVMVKHSTIGLKAKPQAIDLSDTGSEHNAIFIII